MTSPSTPSSRICRRLVLITIVGLIGYFLIDRTRVFIARQRIQPYNFSASGHPTFLVDTPLCKIPDFDPFDSSIRHIVKKTGSRKCPQNASLTYESGNSELTINWTAAALPPYNGDVVYCTYKPIFRPKYTPTHNNFLRYLPESAPFNDSVEVPSDFVKVNCYNNEDQSVYMNFHAFIIPNTTIDDVLNDRLLRHVYKDKITEPLNVMMIGMDSVSRLSFLRQMVKTRQFLSDQLDAFDMSGYNKVADNTFINIVPMTLGKFVSEMPWDESKASEPFDGVDFIWKQFSDRGYRTFYAEDAPDIAIFDFLKAGFNTPPTDYFNRPMSNAMEMNPKLWFNGHQCFQDRLETEIVLDYLFKFVDVFRRDPYFAFTFITRLSHEDVNSAGAADEPYFKFFKKLQDNDLLRNTVVIFFSDHGMRFGKIRETFIGKLEERLPFMYVTVPKWLRKSYPFLEKNLRMNQHRLSTPFDIYETLQDVLYFNGEEKEAPENARGISLFREVPVSRSCDDAGILPHWCTCLHQEAIPLHASIVEQASEVLLNYIKTSLSDFHNICEQLQLVQIRGAVRLVESEDVLKFLQRHQVEERHLIFGETTKATEDIQIVIETVPGNALFEATVRVDTVHLGLKVIGDVSRINIYGHQSDCIDVFNLKKFCQCKGYN